MGQVILTKSCEVEERVLKGFQEEKKELVLLIYFSLFFQEGTFGSSFSYFSFESAAVKTACRRWRTCQELPKSVMIGT